MFMNILLKPEKLLLLRQFRFSKVGSIFAYGDLTWENSSNPDSYALWYTMIIGHYTQYST